MNMSTKLSESATNAKQRSPEEPPDAPSEAAVERGIAEGLEDIKKGRVDGPYKSADSFLRALRRDAALLTQNNR